MKPNFLRLLPRVLITGELISLEIKAQTWYVNYTSNINQPQSAGNRRSDIDVM